MDNKKISGIFALAIISLLGIGFVAAMPFGNGMNADLTEEDFEAMETERAQVQQAIENGDYDTWAALMEERIAKMQESITEENFEALVDKHAEREDFRQAMEEARESGDFSEMRSLKEECGFEEKQGFHKRMNFQRMD